MDSNIKQAAWMTVALLVLLLVGAFLGGCDTDEKGMTDEQVSAKVKHCTDLGLVSQYSYARWAQVARVWCTPS